ncbi:MAG: hypothetical protein AB7V16_07340 [Vulcanibacillus sp.]
MVRLVSSTKITPIKECVHCPFYDEVLSSNTMDKIYLCTDENNPKISHNKTELYEWFNTKCTYPFS